MTRHPGQVEMDESAATLMARPLPSSLGAFCAAQAKTHGDAIAIDFFQEGVTLTYAALHHRSNRVAANLLARGFRKGAHIAVMLPNGPASVLVWFAIMKIGAVIVPVNTAYGGKELDFLLNHSDALTLIIDARYLAQLDEMQQRPSLLSDPIVTRGIELGVLEDGGPLADFDPGYPVVATDQASVQYTSGTTGFPKGCMLTQDYWLLIAHSVAQVQAGYGCSRLFYWAPFFYMDGQWSFLSAIALGGRAIIASQMSLTKYLGWLRDHDAHFCVLPEPVLKTVPATPQDADLPVKFAFTFGWRPSARAEAEARFNLIARDGFGMTEVGTALSCPRAAGDKLAVNTVGLPSPWRETRVVDESGKECP
ncbi:MAG: class I adenylate-forming enzyme family protein, partial [Phaeobacter gallaeciensis]